MFFRIRWVAKYREKTQKEAVQFTRGRFPTFARPLKGVASSLSHIYTFTNISLTTVTTIVTSKTKPTYVLQQFDGKTVALEIPQSGETFVFSGVGRFELDPKLGQVLRITPPHVLEGQPEVLIRQDTWAGTVWRGEEYEVDFLFKTAVPEEPSKNKK